MNSIEVLDKNTIDKIAAGEVVERPSSIVKELVENAIDAGSTAVNVEIKDGGIGLSRITDNGHGIPKDQIQKAFLRHSTSKLRSVDDLNTISSHGFRGEALSSIAAVSQVELITKTGGQLTGCRYIIEGGEEKKLEEVGAPDGTTIIIRNVFYNTPARKKFLKSVSTEAGYIAGLMERLALSHPGVSFNYIQNGQVKLHSSGNGKLKDIAFGIYGREISNNLVEVDTCENSVHIHGYICKPVVSRGNRNYENYFVNERFVRNNIISRAIEDAYKPFLMQHRYPFTLLLIDVPGDVVDVNVHPAKQEVRFDNAELIYNAVYKVVFDALSKRELIPEISFDDLRKKPQQVTKTEEKPKDSHLEPFEVKRHEEVKKESNEGFKFMDNPIKDVIREESVFNNNISVKPNIQIEVKETKAEQLSFSDMLPEEDSKPAIRIVGQVFDTYWIIEYDGRMLIIDQHAAHEKVKYEQIMNSLKQKEHSSQLLSPPLVVTLSDSEQDVLRKNMEHFERLGFEIEAFGGNEYTISAVPVNIFSMNFQDVFIEILDSMTEGFGNDSETMLDRIATMSCKAAVKGNNKLSFLEAEALINEMFTLENPYNCPHGRPTTISMSKYELEKKFKRII